jgi:hypothetical protein
MSLAVPADLLDRARRGEVDDAAFVDCVRTSLPYAWGLITGLITNLEASGGEFADNQVPPPDEASRGQLLRLMASDAMRAAIERHHGVRLAFQNCHRAAVFRPTATAALAEFTSARSQLLNQSPELVDCLSIYPNGRWRFPVRHRPFGMRAGLVGHRASVRDQWTELGAGSRRRADPRRRTTAQPWPSRKNPAAMTPT